MEYRTSGCGADAEHTASARSHAATEFPNAEPGRSTLAAMAAASAPPTGRERIGSRLTGLNAVLEQDPAGPGTTLRPRRDGESQARKKRCFTLPPSLLTRFDACRYRREDLISAALDQLHDALHDRTLPRPLYPIVESTGRSTTQVTIRMHQNTYMRMKRLANRNGWSVSSTLACLMHHFEPPDYWTDATA